MMTLFALAGAWVLRAQYVSSRRLADLLLVAAALGLGLINFATAALPAALNLHAGTYFAVAELWGALFVGAIFAVAAVSSDRLVARRGQPVLITGLPSVIALAGAGIAGLLLRTHESIGAFAGTPSHPLEFGLVIGAAGLFLYAASGFARRQWAEADGVAGLLAVALILMAGASFAHLLPQSLVPGRIDIGVALGAIASAAILTAALLRERQAHARIARATALAERRRVARDLHDGIAQDLAFIAAHGPRFAQELGDDHPVVVAARRALAISRSTISDLSDAQGATAHEALEAVAQELRDRFGIAIAVDAQLQLELESGAREHVTRIAREAIANAARHGQARNVIVSLRHTEDGVALRILDDGCGIAGADSDTTPEGFGLRSMRERAAAMGGHLSVRQPRRGGTELEVVLP
jgi:signal transduction histidine kinase